MKRRCKPTANSSEYGQWVTGACLPTAMHNLRSSSVSLWLGSGGSSRTMRVSRHGRLLLTLLLLAIFNAVLWAYRHQKEATFPSQQFSAPVPIPASPPTSPAPPQALRSRLVLPSAPPHTATLLLRDFEDWSNAVPAVAASAAAAGTPVRLLDMHFLSRSIRSCTLFLPV